MAELNHSRRDSRCLLPTGWFRRAGWGLLALALGCATSMVITPSTRSIAQQQADIEKLVPVGTPRDEALERLQEAGIEGTFGERETIYYCDLWRQPDGTATYIDVALLFDAEGLLSGTRPGTTSMVRQTAGTPSEPKVQTPSAPSTSRLQQSVAEPQSEESEAPSHRRGRRSPFSE